MPYLFEVHHFFSQLPALTAVGPLVLILSVMLIVHYLRLNRQLLEQNTDQKRVSIQLQKLNTAVEQSPASIVITDREGFIEYVNPAFCRLTGYSSEESIGQHTRILKGEEQSPEHYRNVWETILAGNEWRGEFHNRRKDGSFFWELASISPIRGEGEKVTHFVAVKEDITERKQLLERLDRLAHYDKVTSIPNRTLFFDRLNQVIAVSRRERQRFALLFIDLDGFKQVNDNYGHEAGDLVLKETALRLLASVRESDTVARMGGDEFVVMLCNIADHDDAGLVADKILNCVSCPIELSGGKSCVVGSSIGISIYPDDSLESEQLINFADTAMYTVKRAGKNGYRFYAS